MSVNGVPNPNHRPKANHAANVLLGQAIVGLFRLLDLYGVKHVDQLDGSTRELFRDLRGTLNGALMKDVG